MNSPSRTLLAGAVLAAFPLLAGAAIVSPELSAELAATQAGETVPVIIQLADRVDLRQFRPGARNKRNSLLLRALKDKSSRTQGPLISALASAGGSRLRQLWIINGVAAELRPAAIQIISRFPGVGRISLDATVSPPATATASSGTAQWNIDAVHALDLWGLGYDGSGIIVANLDTGVDPNHPDLVGKWRGGGNSWFDPHGQHATPYDASGHGTQTMGLMVGGSASGSAIGVAPNARWIAAKIFNDAGQGQLSDIHLAFQWVLDPDGNTATADAPDVVNASWGLTGGAPGSCNLEFDNDIAALKASGVAVVYSAGNDGPSPSTSVSPANNPDGFSTGSVDSQSVIAGNSSRGSSGCDNSIFPKLVAPGVNVVTADLSFGGLPVYANVSGTSFAAPHVAGLMALLMQAFPAATVADLEISLTQTATDLGASGADNTYGYGMADGFAAYNALAVASGGHPPAITSSPVNSANQDQAYSYQVTATDPDGDALTFTLDTAPSGMSIGSTTGLIAWTPNATQVGANAVAVRVTDATSLSVTQNFSISVIASNRPPTAGNDSYSVNSGAALSVAAPGVLANDGDPDGNAISAVPGSAPGHGTLTLNANGSFVYTPSAGYSGSDTFTYSVSDGALTSNTATVTLTVVAAANVAPVAKNDSFTAPRRRNGSYTPQVFNVLGNDRDTDGTLNVASVTIVTTPNKGGSVVVNANGTVSYTPALNYTGKETFKYTVRDNLGAASNAATVTVTVR
ncbi:MAG: Ig-like domain-containing protein [Propionivibrio sp.]